MMLFLNFQSAHLSGRGGSNTKECVKRPMHGLVTDIASILLRTDLIKNNYLKFTMPLMLYN